MQPLYSVPSRKTLTEKLIPYYVEEISTYIKYMVSEAKYVAVTTDIWSSDSNKSFLRVTSHFIHDDKHKNMVLETKELPGRHTDINIADCLTKYLINGEFRTK